MTYREAVDLLYSLGNELKTAKLGLERIAAVLPELDHPERHSRIVHVAGTNGKGSTCAMIASGLRAEGLRTGLFTSPHLVEPVERIQVDSACVDQGEFARVVERVHRAAAALLDAGRIDLHPTYFETVTAAGFLAFRDQRTDASVIETGLGGRLDATNVVLPEVTVITSVDLDHQQWLGTDVADIAREKAGILKPGVPLVVSRQRRAAREMIEAVARERGVPVTSAPRRIEGVELHPGGSRFRACFDSGELGLECNLPGEHQIDNAVTAAAALLRMGVPEAAVIRGVREARWPGRLERVATNPDIYLDGAHNTAGVRALANYLNRFFRGADPCIVFASMRDKSLPEMAELLAPLAGDIVLTAIRNERARAPEDLAAGFPHSRIHIARGTMEAIARARELRPKGPIFITGSLYLVGEARALLVQ